MDLSEGMVAMVQGLPDSALAVTLLDGSRQYTLVPNNDAQQPSYVHNSQRPIQYASKGVYQDKDYGINSNSGIQAVDGRYASVYQVAHCKVQPTSPPVQLTEFPPQRAEPCRGQGNFEVGGLGSGETKYSPVRANGSYNGGMCWSERGAVFSPRPSHEPDAFANSLRKYPHMSPEKASEVIDRLINYTQAKNCKPTVSRQCSPARSDSNNSNQGCDRRSCISSMRSQRLHEAKVVRHLQRPHAAVSISIQVLQIPDDSPTRETTRNRGDFASFENQSLFGNNPEVRCLQDMGKKIKDSTSTKNNSSYPYNNPVSPCTKERYDNLPPEKKRPEVCTVRTNSVNMETQGIQNVIAEVPMISKEVATVPRKQPTTRNVAVPSCPSASHIDSVQLQPRPVTKHIFPYKSIQTSEALDLTLKIRKSAQTCMSSIDLPQEMENKVENDRKSKSQEELRRKDNHDDVLRENVIQLIKNLSTSPETDCQNVRNGLLRNLRKLHKTDPNDRVKIKFGKCIKDQLYPHVNFKNFTNELSEELISKIKSHKMFISSCSTHVYRAETDLSRNCKDDNPVDELIKDWLNHIPIKQQDYLGRPVKKEHILHTVASQIYSLIINKDLKDNYYSLKPEIFKILEDIPIEVNALSKMYYLNRILNDLLSKIDHVNTSNATDRKIWTKADGIDKKPKNKLSTKPFIVTHVQPTEEELKEFVKKELKDLTDKFSLKICPSTQDEIQVELTDILIDSIETIRYENDEQVKEEVLVVLSEHLNVSQHQAQYFVNNVINNVKLMFKETFNNSQSLILSQDTDKHPSLQQLNNPTDISIEGITNQDMQNNLDLYNQLIVQEITEWMLNIPGLSGVDAGCLQVAAYVLAGKIVDRYTYIEQNFNNKSTEVIEMKYLKNLIINWVSKLVEENNSETIEKVSELMHRIRKIPAPMLTKPVQNTDTSRPLCCQQSLGPRINTSRKARRSTGYPTRSPGAISTELVQRCGVACKNNKNGSSMKNTAEATSEPKRVSFSQATSTSLMAPPREVPRNRRFSGPASFLFGSTPEAGPSQGYPVETTSPVRLPSPARTSQPNDPKDNSMIMTSGSPIQQLNDEYDEFLKTWVQRIPIPSSNPQEAELAEKMRQGIYNGVWEAIAEIKMNQEAMNNPFYYQDLLDEKLEGLLGLLPQTPELAHKKHMLKSQLIENTSNMNEQILNTVAPSSFKNQLIQNVSNNLDRYYIDLADQNIHKACEELHKLNLVEGFILLSKYRTDNVKANVYKRKLKKHIQELFDDLKRGHGKEMIDIDLENFQGEIVNSLLRVPLPSDDTLKKEVTEILIGLEIDQWFSDLPLKPASNRVEELTNMRNRDVLATKVHDMEKQTGLANCENELRQEIMRYMSRLPLTQEEAENTPFMVEELVSRLKNRTKDIVSGSGLNFVEPNDYDDFSRNMQLCSSFTDSPDSKRAQINQSSYLIINGTRVKDSDYPYRDQDAKSRHQDTIPSDQYYTIESEGPIPSQMLSGLIVTRDQTFANDYDDFSKNMQLCSSFTDSPDAKRAQIDQKSHLITNGTRVKDSDYPYRDQDAQNRHQGSIPSDQYYTIESEGPIPSQMLSGSRVPSDQTSANDYEDFSRNMQLCSSCTDSPDAKRAYIDQSSNLKSNGTRIKDFKYPYRDPDAQNRHQYYTIESEGLIPSQMLSGSRVPRDPPYVRQTDNGQGMQSIPQDIGGQVWNPPQDFKQTRAPPNVRDEMIGGEVPPDLSFRDPVTDARMLQRNQRQIQSPQTSRFPDANIFTGFPDQRSLGFRGPGGFQGDPNVSSGFLRQTTISDQRSPGLRGPGGCQRDSNISGGFPEQKTAKDQIYPGFRGPGSIQRDPNISGGFPGQITIPVQRSPVLRGPGGIQGDPKICGGFPDQRTVPDQRSTGLRGPGSIQRNQNIYGGFPGQRTVQDQRFSRLRGPGGIQGEPNISDDFPGQIKNTDRRSPGLRGPGGIQGDPNISDGFSGHINITDQKSLGLRGPEGIQGDPDISDGFPGQRNITDQISPGLRGPGGFQGDPNISSSFPGQRTALDKRCPGFRRPGGFQGDPNISGGIPGQRTVPDQRSPGIRRPGGFQGDPNISGGFPGQRTIPDLRFRGFKGPGGLQEDPYVSSDFPQQRNDPDQTPQGFQGPGGHPGTIQEDHSYRSPRFSPVPTEYAPESSTRPYETTGYGSERFKPYETSQASTHEPRGTGQLLVTARPPSPGAFSRQPMGFSTPQQSVCPRHESRPKKRTQEVTKSQRDLARKRLDLEDSNDSGVEMRCHCMDRVWRCKRRPVCRRYDDYEMDFPQCFPIGYTFPCYF